MSDIESLVAELDRRTPDLEKATAYYEGSWPEEFVDPRVSALISGSSPGDRFNFARLVVSAVLDRLTITSVGADNDRATEVLAECWRQNVLGVEANEVNRWALVRGRELVVVWPDADTIGVYRNSALTTLVAYDPERPARKRWAGKRWTEGEGSAATTRVTLYYPDRIERWVSSSVGASAQADFGLLEAETPNPFGFVPVFEFRAQASGRPEHRDAYGPQGLINKLIATHRASVDYYGFPMRWLVSDEVEVDSGLETGPGKLWTVPGKDSRVGQFSTADPEAYLAPLREYVQSMALVTQTSMRRLTGGDWPSGDALRASERSEVTRSKDRLASLDWSWREVCACILTMSGTPGEPSVQWAPVESHDDADKWDTVAAKIGSGVPVEEALVQAGYERATVQAWLAPAPDSVM